MSFIEQLHHDREDLARVLKKHAGIRRIVEDLYPDSAHFIYELLQNAEDTGASEATFHLSEDKLVFEHNGREFDEADMEAITDIGEGTKAEDDEQIGRFGIGFKAVFAYTETPHIWSPSYSFKISDMVLPSVLPPKQELDGNTRFEFPFNSEKKPRSQAFSEVRDCLEDISDRTLLFLSHIESIQWRVDGGESRLLRIPHSDLHLEILREIECKPTESSHFLRFQEPIDGLENRNVAIAFELEPLSGEQRHDEHSSFANRFRIVPAEPGCVAVYFTAAKETSNLRFHLHAPFVPELSRSSIKETPTNEPLFRQLAELAARSLSTIRYLGLLDRDFLAVLPNNGDGIPDQYSVIRDTIVSAMNEHPLTPTHADGHAPARLLLKAEAGLKDLLDREDIRFLTDGEDDRRDWAIAATQRNSLVDRFLDSLEIEVWGVEQFVDTLDERCSNRRRYWHRFDYYTQQAPDQPFLDWMRRKPLDWHRALYAVFHRVLENRLSRFNQICIVRRSDGEYGTGDECYFPTPGTREDPINPRVEEATYSGGGTKDEQTRAKAFLEGIGVREIGEFEQVKAILERRYSDPEQIPSRDTHASDLGRFISLVERDSGASTLFDDYFMLHGADGLLHKPSDLYLDSPYPETGLEAYYGRLEADAGRTALSDRYHQLSGGPERFVKFAGRCGVADSLEVSTVDCSGNPEYEHLRKAPGSFPTNTGIDRDFTIHWLQALFEKPTLALSRLVWNTLCDRQRDRSILIATYRVNQSNEPHHAASQLVHVLWGAAWVPQVNSGLAFVRPAEAVRDLLPDGFPFDPGWDWLDAIQFGAEDEGRAAELRRVQDLAEKLGFRDTAALNDAIRFVKLEPGIRQSILAEHAAPADLPEHTPDNPDRRAEGVRKEARNAARRRTEKRQRSVSANRERVKREGADPYLRELYTNADGETICQACQDRLPFKLADGRYYFETVEFLPELDRHHHQNYLALCPNHAAMFMHANNSKEDMRKLFRSLDGNRLELTLAKQSVTVYFTDTHIQDLRVVIEINDEG